MIIMPAEKIITPAINPTEEAAIRMPEAKARLSIISDLVDPNLPLPLIKARAYAFSELASLEEQQFIVDFEQKDARYTKDDLEALKQIIAGQSDDVAAQYAYFQTRIPPLREGIEKRVGHECKGKPGNSDIKYEARKQYIDTLQNLSILAINNLERRKSESPSQQ